MAKNKGQENEKLKSILDGKSKLGKRKLFSIKRPKGNLLRIFQKVLSTFLISLIVFVIAGVAYLAYTNSRLEKLNAVNSYETCSNAEGSTIQESYPATCVTPDGRSFIQPLSPEEQRNLNAALDVTNWKTYMNNEFSFRYPSTWQDAETNIQSTRTSVIIDDGIEYDYLISRLEIISGSYYNQDLQREMTIDEVIGEQQLSKEEGATSESMTLGDYKGYRHTYRGHGVGHYITNIILAKPEFPTYILYISYRHNNSEYKSEMPATLRQILSTFKFIDSNDSYVSFSDVLNNPDQYSGLRICTEGYFYSAFETSAFLDNFNEETKQFPSEIKTWARNETGENIIETSSSVNKYGALRKIQACGLFETKGNYGHLGRFEFQFDIDSFTPSGRTIIL